MYTREELLLLNLELGSIIEDLKQRQVIKDSLIQSRAAFRQPTISTRLEFAIRHFDDRHNEAAIQKLFMGNARNGNIVNSNTDDDSTTDT